MKKLIPLMLAMCAFVAIMDTGFAAAPNPRKEKANKELPVRLAGETIGMALKGQEADRSRGGFVDKIVEFKPVAKSMFIGKLENDSAAKYFAGINDGKIAWLRVAFDKNVDEAKLFAALDKELGKPKSSQDSTARVYSKNKIWAVYRDKKLHFSSRKQIVRVEAEYIMFDLSSGKIGGIEALEERLSVLPPKDKEAMTDLFMGIISATQLPGDITDYGMKYDRDASYMQNVWLPQQFELALKGEGAVKIYRERVKNNTACQPAAKLEEDNYDWYARHERILKEAKGMSPEIVLIGDSITHHWAGLNSIGGEDATPHFKAAFGGKRVLDLGFGWDRIQNMLWRVENGELLGLRPKTIIIMAGTNNMTGTKNARANSAEEIAYGVMNLIASVKRSAPPQTKVIVMGILPRAGKNDPMRQVAKEANAHLKKFAEKKGLVFIDLSDKFVDESGERLKPLYRDQVHLTPAGYAIWAEAIKTYL